MSTLNVQKFRKLCKIADFEKVMRLKNGTGATALWHGQRAPRAGEFYESNVYERIVNCATGCFLRAPQALGVTGRRPDKLLVFNISRPLIYCNSNNCIIFASYLFFIFLNFKIVFLHFCGNFISLKNFISLY